MSRKEELQVRISGPSHTQVLELAGYLQSQENRPVSITEATRRAVALSHALIKETEAVSTIENALLSEGIISPEDDKLCRAIEMAVRIYASLIRKKNGVTK